MGILELILLAVGLSMDAFAVSVCKGLSLGKAKLKSIFIIALWFGGFQALMPAIGYFLGLSFQIYIETYDHWIAFVLLSLIGFNMIRESFSKESDKSDASLSFKTMIWLAIATSIDALAAGITFSFFISGIMQLLLYVGIIGVVTFAFSSLGVKIGSVFGTKYKAGAERAGGIILVLLGLKILLEHLNVINF